jgi:hypothetical protein
MALWNIINVDDTVLIPENRDEKFAAYFCTRNFLCRGGISLYASNKLIVALSTGDSVITSFRQWLPIASGNHLDRSEKFQCLLRHLEHLMIFIKILDSLRGEIRISKSS